MEQNSKPLSVYLVEDSQMILERLNRLIGLEPGLAIVGTSGHASIARQEIDLHQPEVVIIDIALEEGDGFDVLEHTRSLGKPPLAIMLTNYTYMSYRARALEAGAQYFFDKSTEFDSVVNILRRHARPVSGESPGSLQST